MKALASLVAMLLSVLCCWSQTITKAEYFFDSDPGPGNGVSLPVTPGATVNQNFSLSTATLGTGFHTINTRVKTSTGDWSLFASRTFFLIPPTITFIPATQVTSAEYFIDSDPGVGQATPVAFTAGASVTLSLNIPTTALSPGFHTINVRSQDNQKRWSLFGQRTFYIVPPVNNVTSSSITKAEYFFDSDPGVGNGTALPITSGNPQNNTFSLDVSTLAAGFHQLAIRYRDNRGQWSHFVNRTFWIVNVNTLSASVVRKLEYFIDVNPENNSAINGTGVPVTPAANINEDLFIDLGALAPGTHTIYIRAQDDRGFWSTVRKADFTILNCTTPTPPIAPAVSRCGTGILTLTANGATTGQVYRWYEDNATSSVLQTGTSFQTPTLTATRNYFVSIFDPATSCESARTAVTAQISLSTKPVIDPAGSVSLCAGGAVILSAPTGFSQYVWSTGETTRQILVSTAGQYSVRVGDGVCVSPSSDVVEVTVTNGPPKPLVTITGITTICESGSVVLTGPAGLNYQWSNGATTQSITVSASGFYSLTVSNGTGCPSVSSDPVPVVVQSQPCGDIIACVPPSPPEVFGASRCGQGTLTLRASGATGSQNYRWYETSSSSTSIAAGSDFVTPQLGTSRDYYVTIVDLTTLCESNRVAVRASVNLTEQPSIIPDGNVSVCTGTTTTLTAPPGFSQYIWSTGETTRQISVGITGAYTLQVGDGTCVSPLSAPVNVTVVSKPVKPNVSINGSTTICGSGATVLTAPPGFEYRWSNGANTQSITISSSGAFFVSVVNSNNCESDASDAVIVTVQTPPCGTATNQAPVIDEQPLAAQIEGKVSLDLTSIVSDPDNNLDYSSIRLLSGVTARGAPASVDASYNLTIDYSGLPFSGVDRVVIEACDLSGACIQTVIDIEVAGAVVVYNGVTPDGDGKNDFLLLKYIDVLDGARENRVVIFNRWGDVVFEVDNYNNNDRVFTGIHKNGSELPPGTYYYKIEFAAGLKSLTGFLTLLR